MMAEPTISTPVLPRLIASRALINPERSDHTQHTLTCSVLFQTLSNLNRHLRHSSSYFPTEYSSALGCKGLILELLEYD